MAYNSKYTGVEVESLLEKVEGLTVPTKTSELENDSGFITDAALAGYATTSAVEGKQDKLAYYSEGGGDATIDASDGSIELTTGNTVTITGDGGITLATGVTASTNINSYLIVNSDVDLCTGGMSQRAYYHGAEIATVSDVATPADSVNATKNAVLSLTSDDLLAERDKWFDAGGAGYLPTLFEVMDYSATTYQVRLRCYVNATDVGSMIELECDDKVVSRHPAFVWANGAGMYVFDILVPYMDGAFTALPYKYTIEDA